MEKRYVKITGTGSYLPNDPVPFDSIHQVLGEVKEAPDKIQRWVENIHSVLKEIIQVKYYHYAIDPVTREHTDDNISMSVKAAKVALEASGLKPENIDLLIYGAPYMHQMPCGSVRIQEELGIENCAEFSIQANCTSSYKAILLAEEFLKNGRYKNALIVSSHMPSSQFRAESLNQQLLKKEDLILRWFLSDGAGSIVLQSTDDYSNGFFVENCYTESVGTHKPSLMHTSYPPYFLNPKVVYEKALHHLKQKFQQEITEFFIEENGTVFINGLKRMLAQYPIDINRLKIFQINMPSMHIVDLIMEECEKLGINKSQLFSTIGEMGYAGPPASYISLDKIIREKAGEFEDDNLIVSFVTEVSKFMQAGYIVRYKK